MLEGFSTTKKSLFFSIILIVPKTGGSCATFCKFLTDLTVEMMVYNIIVKNYEIFGHFFSIYFNPRIFKRKILMMNE